MPPQDLCIESLPQKNIFGPVDYMKTYVQGIVVAAFDGRQSKGKNTVWMLWVNFEMPSDDPDVKVIVKVTEINHNHCILGWVLAGKDPLSQTLFTNLIGNPDHAIKGSTTTMTATTMTRRNPLASRVILVR